jgi:hypothetical protein
MDIEKLKDKLGDETFTALRTFVDDLTGQRDAARNESIDKRKTLKAENDTLKAFRAKALEKLGVDSDDDLDALPDAKGQAEAAKQYDARIKKLERERNEATAARDEAAGRLRGSQQKATIAEALGKHEFVARDVVEAFVSPRLVWEGEEILFKTDDGKLVAVADGVAGIAKSRPELLKATGTGGAGVRSNNAGGGGGQKQMTRADFEAMSPAAKVEAAKAGVTLV